MGMPDGDPGFGEPEPSGSDPQQRGRRLSGPATFLVGLFLLGEAALFLWVVLAAWPAVTAVTGGSGTLNAAWRPLGLGQWTLTSDTALLLVVLVCSGLGSFVHAATSFATYVGNRRLYSSWVWWYVLRTGIGAALALLVYFLLRGGLFAGGTQGSATNPYGFAGIAGLCGLFSKQATDKLREVFDTVLSTGSDGDQERRDKPLPAEEPVSAAAPAAAEAVGPGAGAGASAGAGVTP
jgi:hypothetical protein